MAPFLFDYSVTEWLDNTSFENNTDNMIELEERNSIRRRESCKLPLSALSFCCLEKKIYKDEQKKSNNMEFRQLGFKCGPKFLIYNRAGGGVSRKSWNLFVAE